MCFSAFCLFLNASAKISLTGLHALELAKTEWNTIFGRPASTSPDPALLNAVKLHLDWAESVLAVSSSQGSDAVEADEVTRSPQESLKLLRTLVKEEEMACSG